jgi:xanthine dehydrogenase small subunit
LRIGAAATYAEAESALRAIDADVGEVLRRLGSKQVRAAGTVGGNIANGSPIGDSPPLLIALGASICLRHGDERRTLALEDFFIDYGKQDLRAGEVIVHIDVPRLGEDEHLRCYKISKRYDQDISALLGAFRLRVHAGRVTSARIAFGGMAATPKRAVRTETTVTGLALGDEAGWAAAADALSDDFSPIDDLRASAAYRMQTSRAMLAKVRIEMFTGASDTTRVVGIRPAELRV